MTPRGGSRRRLTASLALIVGLVGCQQGTTARGSGARLVVVSFGTGISGMSVTVSNVVDDTVEVTLRNDRRDPNLPAADTTIRDDILLEDVRVGYDAGGAATPRPFRSGLSLRIPPASEATATIVIVQASAKVEPPLSALTRPTTMTATVVFHGRDGKGEGVNAQGTLNVTFLP